MMKPRIADVPSLLAPEPGLAGARAGWRRPRLSPCLAIALVAAVVCAASCQRSGDPAARGRERTLDADERYLVEHYQKIIDVEENLHDNQAVREEKRQALAAEIDTLRIRRVLSRLENDPERWLAIYARLNEIASRSAPGDTTGRY